MLILLLHIFCVGLCFVDCSEETERLREDLFYHSYDKQIIPQEDEDDPLDVHLGVAPTWVDLDSNGVMSIILWLKLSWKDHRLSWDPSRYQDINMLRQETILTRQV